MPRGQQPGHPGALESSDPGLCPTRSGSGPFLKQDQPSTGDRPHGQPSQPPSTPHSPSLRMLHCPGLPKQISPTSASELILWQFWKAEVHSQAVSRAGSLWRLGGRVCFTPLILLLVAAGNPWCSLVQRHRCNFCLCHPAVSFPSVRLCPLLFSSGPQSLDLGPNPIQPDLILT